MAQKAKSAKSIVMKAMMAGAVVFCIYSCDETSDIFGDGETADGLKAALGQGIDYAAGKLGKKDGYLADAAVHIGVPEEASTTFNAISKLGETQAGQAVLKAAGTNIGASMEETMDTLFNRAAEDAAPKSVAVFKETITGMTIDDAEGILFGSDNAATEYLHTKSYTGLEDAFSPSVDASLSTVQVAGLTAPEAWQKFAGLNNKLAQLVGGTAGQVAMKLLQATDSKAYGMVSAIKPASTDLGEYVTGKALDGLFVKVADQELQIRTNVSSRTSDVLKKVFGRLDTRGN